MKKGKKYVAVASKVDSNRLYTIEEACALVKETSTVKFDASVDVSFRLNIDPKYADQQLRGTIALPHSNGKTKRILAITRNHEAAKEAGADFVGDKDMLEKIQKENWFGFDVIVATPDMMAELGKMGRLLGPKGLMPNPKTGTVSVNIAQAIKEIKAGKVEYRTDKAGNILVPVGKVSFENDKLVENMKTIYNQLMRIKPSTVKGVYMANVAITATMAPGIKVNQESF